MRFRGIGSLAIIVLAVFGFGLTTPAVVFGQSSAGVIVDAEGVLRTKTAAEADGQLAKERIAAARAALNPKVAAYSRLRYISLKHLEKAIEDRHGVPSAEMQNLAGLLRVRYVFLYPESKDIVIAGPAEGWVTDGFGRFVGLKSGRPTVQLQDLVVALRAFPPEGPATKFIGCSIDPTPEGLAAMQQFLRSTGSVFSAQDAQSVSGQIISGLQTSLGPQTISINGVSPRTHFALVLVEADYRMKLIGIGLEKPPVQLVSYVDRANPAAVSRNALQRWFFTPDYDCVQTGDAGMAMELVGDGVKLVGEGEVVGEEGQRKGAGRTDAASQAFVRGFTARYSELAERSPVYAQLRDLIDLAIAAAYIRHEGFYGKAEWKMDLFGDEQRFAVETYDMPKQVAPAINAIWKGSRLMTPIGGGVAIQPDRAFANKSASDEDPAVGKVRRQGKIELAKGQWWWD